MISVRCSFAQNPNGELEDVTSGRIVFNSLVHGTTLHGKQISWMDNNVFDMFQAMTALNPLENFLVAEANHRFNPPVRSRSLITTGPGPSAPCFTNFAPAKAAPMPRPTSPWWGSAPAASPAMPCPVSI